MKKQTQTPKTTEQVLFRRFFAAAKAVYETTRMCGELDDDTFNAVASLATKETIKELNLRTK